MYRARLRKNATAASRVSTARVRAPARGTGVCLEGHESARARGKVIGGAGVTDDAMLVVAVHLRGQELSLRDIAARLVISKGKKKVGQDEVVGAVQAQVGADERGQAGHVLLTYRVALGLELAHGVLHDRRIPRTRSNIDHIAVAPSGVYVIDAKRYKGRPDLRIRGGILRARTTTLTVGGRDCTKLLDGMHRQVDLVRGALAQSHPDVRVRGMLCFVDADWPLIGGAFSIDHVDVLWPKKAAQVLNGDGPLTGEQVSAIHQLIATAFPVA